ncbi:MAG: hypothetical protein ACXAEB_15845, partial [Candidatus Thorarchaeota archaeon]
RLEVETSYPMILVYGTSAILVYIVLILAFTPFLRGFAFIISFDNLGGNAELLENFFANVETMSLQTGLASINGLMQVLVILVPMLVAFSISKGFEDGTLRTFLSYPIGRTRLLAIKAGFAIALVGVPVNLALLATQLLLYPANTLSIDLLLLVLSFWLFILLIGSISTLISVTFKRVSLASMTGVGLWYSILILTLIGPETYESFLGVFNPINITIKFVIGYGPVAVDLAVSFVFNVLLSLIAFALSIVLFRRAEI